MTIGARVRSNSWLALVGAIVFVGAAGYMIATGVWSRSDAGPVGVRTGLLDDHRLALGEPAPDFALASVRGEGKVIRLSEFRGQVVVVNFYASWCGPCRRELPDFEIIAGEFKNSVAFIAVNVQESQANALRILDETGATFPAVLDTKGDVARRYGLRGMPSTYLLDASGVVRKFGPGAIDADTLRQELKEVVGKAP